jgi:hypothetical protein
MSQKKWTTSEKAVTRTALLTKEQSTVVQANDQVIQFTLKVNAIKRESGGNSIDIDLDLNPYSKIFETEEDKSYKDPENRSVIILNEKGINEIFEFITKQLFPDVKSLAKKDQKDFSKIGRILFKQNSPALSNISYVTAYNGDMRPPKY